MEDPPVTTVGSSEEVQTGAPEAVAETEDVVQTISVPWAFEANVIEVICGLAPPPVHPLSKMAKMNPYKLRPCLKPDVSRLLKDRGKFLLIENPVLFRSNHIAQLQLHADPRKAP